MNTRIKNILYIVVPIVLAVWFLGYEFVWRFDPSLDTLERIPIFNHTGVRRTLLIRQQSSTPVDTIRRTYTDMKNGKTLCTIWIEGSADTAHATATGRYFSEFRPIRLATDSSTQIVLVPNSEHDLPTGWGNLVYLTPGDSIRVLQIINSNISDMNHDGTFELFDKTRGTWTKLDPATGLWTAVDVQYVREGK